MAIPGPYSGSGNLQLPPVRQHPLDYALGLSPQPEDEKQDPTLAALRAFLAPAPGHMQGQAMGEEPGVPVAGSPQSPQEMEQRKKGWADFLGVIKQNPGLLLQLAGAIAQPIDPRKGETFGTRLMGSLGQFGGALGEEAARQRRLASMETQTDLAVKADARAARGEERTQETYEYNKTQRGAEEELRRLQVEATKVDLLWKRERLQDVPNERRLRELEMESQRLQIAIRQRQRDVDALVPIEEEAEARRSKLDTGRVTDELTRERAENELASIRSGLFGKAYNAELEATIAKNNAAIAQNSPELVERNIEIEQEIREIDLRKRRWEESTRPPAEKALGANLMKIEAAELQLEQLKLQHKDAPDKIANEKAMRDLRQEQLQNIIKLQEEALSTGYLDTKKMQDALLKEHFKTEDLSNIPRTEISAALNEIARKAKAPEQAQEIMIRLMEATIEGIGQNKQLMSLIGELDMGEILTESVATYSNPKTQTAIQKILNLVLNLQTSQTGASIRKDVDETKEQIRQDTREYKHG